jgi:hypothetical protein
MHTASRAAHGNSRLRHAALALCSDGSRSGSLLVSLLLSSLQIIIIALIAIEVVLGLMHYVPSLAAMRH